MAMNSKEHIELVARVSARNYNPLPAVITRAEGVWVWDAEGKKYLDCLSAYSSVNQGHRHPRIIQALIDQAAKVTVTSRAFHNDQMGPFLKKVCDVTEMEMALPMNTGVEAVETAVKAARKWGYTKKKVAPDQAEIIVSRDNFHGRTITAVSFSTEAQYREGFGPFTPGFKFIDFGDLRQLEQAIGPNTVGFLTEPIQGEAGIKVPPPGFLAQAKAICKKHNVLFMLDEIQTGLGRTGKLFCYQHETDAKPDMLILGKALGGGVFPVSAVASSREIMGVFNPGDHGSTFGGNPLGSAVGSASLDVIRDENLVERSAASGKYLMERLRGLPTRLVKEVRGKGLMIGIDLKPEAGGARPICNTLKERGILAKDTHETVIRLAPPLVIERAELDFLADTLIEVLR